MTIKLYDENSYLKDFEANVVDCREYKDGYRIILDKTAFFPTEGGQYFDQGKIANMPVTDVFLEGDDVVHVVPYPACGMCKCEIDFDKRFDKMQQHTGEHIVCGIVHKLYGYENVGFHLGDDDVTFDFDGYLSWDQLYEIELLANKAVTDNRKVMAYYPENPESLIYRSKLEISENLRIVEIDGIDMCACCAPHVKETGEVGYIKFTDAYSYKGGVRIHLACGQRAVKYAQTVRQNAVYIAKELSAKPDNVAEFFKKYQQDIANLRTSLSNVKKDLITIKAKSVENQENIILFEDDIDAKLLQKFVGELEDKYRGICAVFCGDDQSGYNYVIASKNKNLRDFIKEFNAVLSGKGGGSSQMVQGTLRALKSEIIEYLIKEA